MQWKDTALLLASEYGHLEATELLIRHGANAQHANKVSRGERGRGCACVYEDVCLVVCSELDLTCWDTLNLTLNLTLTLTITRTLNRTLNHPCLNPDPTTVLLNYGETRNPEP